MTRVNLDCGWAIVGALMKLGPSFVEPRLGQFFALWKPVLNCESVIILEISLKFQFLIKIF